VRLDGCQLESLLVVHPASLVLQPVGDPPHSPGALHWLP
jgi:hypothetical protein